MKELLDNQNFLHNYFSLCLDNKKKRNDHLYLVADVSEGVHDKKYARQFYYKKKKKENCLKLKKHRSYAKQDSTKVIIET